MTDEEEFAARPQLKWTREGDAWIFLYRRRRMGRVVPDKNHPGMGDPVKVDGILSNTANLSWSKDKVMAEACRFGPCGLSEPKGRLRVKIRNMSSRPLAQTTSDQPRKPPKPPTNSSPAQSPPVPPPPPVAQSPSQSRSGSP